MAVKRLSVYRYRVDITRSSGPFVTVELMHFNENCVIMKALLGGPRVFASPAVS